MCISYEFPLGVTINFDWTRIILVRENKMQNIMSSSILRLHRLCTRKQMELKSTLKAKINQTQHGLQLQTKKQCEFPPNISLQAKHINRLIEQIKPSAHLPAQITALSHLICAAVLLQHCDEVFQGPYLKQQTKIAVDEQSLKLSFTPHDMRHFNVKQEQLVGYQNDTLRLLRLPDRSLTFFDKIVGKRSSFIQHGAHGTVRKAQRVYFQGVNQHQISMRSHPAAIKIGKVQKESNHILEAAQRETHILSLLAKVHKAEAKSKGPKLTGLRHICQAYAYINLPSNDPCSDSNDKQTSFHDKNNTQSSKHMLTLEEGNYRLIGSDFGEVVNKQKKITRENQKIYRTIYLVQRLEDYSLYDLMSRWDGVSSETVFEKYIKHRESPQMTFQIIYNLFLSTMEGLECLHSGIHQHHPSIIEEYYSSKTKHLLGIIHKDIKPENILISINREKIEQQLMSSQQNAAQIKQKLASGQFRLTIIDFGLSEVRHSFIREGRNYSGTPCYKAPQLIDNDSYNSGVDVWAAGVILYRLLKEGGGLYDYGSEAAIKDQQRRIKDKISELKSYIDKQIPELKETSINIKKWLDILESCLTTNCSHRKTASAIVKELQLNKNSLLGLSLPTFPLTQQKMNPLSKKLVSWKINTGINQVLQKKLTIETLPDNSRKIIQVSDSHDLTASMIEQQQNDSKQGQMWQICLIGWLSTPTAFRCATWWIVQAVLQLQAGQKQTIWADEVTVTVIQRDNFIKESEFEVGIRYDREPERSRPSLYSSLNFEVSMLPVRLLQALQDCKHHIFSRILLKQRAKMPTHGLFNHGINKIRKTLLPSWVRETQQRLNKNRQLYPAQTESFLHTQALILTIKANVAQHSKGPIKRLVTKTLVILEKTFDSLLKEDSVEQSNLPISQLQIQQTFIFIHKVYAQHQINLKDVLIVYTAIRKWLLWD